MAVVLDNELLVLQTQHLKRCTAIVEGTPLGVFPGFFPLESGPDKDARQLGAM